MSLGRTGRKQTPPSSRNAHPYHEGLGGPLGPAHAKLTGRSSRRRKAGSFQSPAATAQSAKDGVDARGGASPSVGRAGLSGSACVSPTCSLSGGWDECAWRGARYPGSPPLRSPLWGVLSAGSSLSVSEGGSGAAGTPGRPARALAQPPADARQLGSPRSPAAAHLGAVLKRRRRLRSRTFGRPRRRGAPGFVPRINSPGRLRGRGRFPDARSARRGEGAPFRAGESGTGCSGGGVASRGGRSPDLPGAGSSSEHRCPLSLGPRGGSRGCKVSSARFQVGRGRSPRGRSQAGKARFKTRSERPWHGRP